MPKFIDVDVVKISGDFTASVPTEGLWIRGRLFGRTSDGIPPEDEDELDLFTFPNGPIAVRHHHDELINTTARTFTLRNPTFDPPGLAGKKLRFGGTLIEADSGDLFAESFESITTFTHTQVGQEHTHAVRFINGSQEIRVDFVLVVTSSF